MADDLLRLVLAHLARRADVPAIVVTAPVGGGKTTALLALADELKRRQRTVAGIVAPRRSAHGATVGYDVCDLASGERTTLALRQPPGIAVGRYWLRPAGLALADRAIRQGLVHAEVVVLDEVGPAELAGQGHYPALMALLAAAPLPVLSVRRSLLERVRETLGLEAAPVYDVPTARPGASALR